MAKVMIALDREELSGLQTMIVVEGWNKIASGSVRRKFLAEFSEQERVKIRKLYNVFYKWNLVSGVPSNKAFKPETIDLIRRAVYFFASA